MAARQNQGAKTHERKTTRANLLLETEAYQKLFVTSVMARESAGDIVSRLISEHLKSYALPAKLSERPQKHDRAIPTPELNPDAPALLTQDAA